VRMDLLQHAPIARVHVSTRRTDGTSHAYDGRKASGWSYSEKALVGGSALFSLIVVVTEL
jgi:hypothetical protein